MNADTPQIASSCYATSTTDVSQILNAFSDVHYGVREFQNWGNDKFPHLQQNQQQTDQIMATPSPSRRIVQVFIADPNENVPLDKSVLYTGEQKLTDLNDTELFFEIPIAETLKRHNEMRVTCVDREASKRAGKDILLDPAKIRDLKMVVVTVAAF